MYLSHFELKEKPFKISTDPRFLWLGEKHKEALATLLYGILYNDGYVVVTGDVGTGKTTLASALMNELGDRVIAVKVPFPDFESLDFLKLISTAYGIDSSFQTKGSFFSVFASFLHSSSSAGKKVILIIDEAQRLTAEHLKELLHLSNIEENGTRLLNIVFVGQNEFNDILLEESNRALRQRVTINYNLGTLTQEETGQYIAHRLMVAQGKREIFSSGSFGEIFLYSGGVPRLINIVCDLALLMTYFEGEKIVKPQTIKNCVQRLRLPSEKTGGGKSGFPLPSGMDEEIKIEIDEKVSDEVKAEKMREGGRKRIWVKAVYGFAFVVLILLVGSIFFLSHQKVSPPKATSVEPRREGEQTGYPAQKEMESAKEKGAPDLGPLPVKEPGPSAEAAKGSDPSAPQPESTGSGETRKFEDANVRVEKPKKRETMSLKASAVPARKTTPESLGEKARTREKEKIAKDREKAASEGREEKISRGSGSATGPPGRETPIQSAGEIDPDKVIEWLMERRSDKK